MLMCLKFHSFALINRDNLKCEKYKECVSLGILSKGDAWCVLKLSDQGFILMISR